MMKKILFILLLLPFWCVAQPITDTTGKYKLGGSTLLDNTSIPTSAFKAADSACIKLGGYGMANTTIDTLPSKIIGTPYDSTFATLFISNTHISCAVYHADGICRWKYVRPTDTLPALISKWTDASKARRGGMWFADTAKVIMLVCDTSSSRYFLGKNILVDELFYNNNLSWQYGYKVTSYTSSPYYLNESKERLPKNIIVWDYKEIKQ